MKPFLLLLLFILSISVQGQFLRRNEKQPEHHYYITGTWLVTKHHTWWHGEFTEGPRLGEETYYQFGDSLNWSLSIMTFVYDSVPKFYRTLITQWDLLDSTENSCWVDPSQFYWTGHYCPYEGYGGGWKIAWINDSIMKLTMPAYGFDIILQDTMWLTRVSHIHSTTATQLNLFEGSYRQADFNLEWYSGFNVKPNHFVSFRSEITDSTYSQSIRYYSAYVKDTIYHDLLSTVEFHSENFLGKTLIFNSDRSFCAWVIRENENSVWVCGSSDCQVQLMNGSIRFIPDK